MIFDSDKLREQLNSDVDELLIKSVSEEHEADLILEYVLARLQWENDHRIEISFPHYVHKARFCKKYMNSIGESFADEVLYEKVLQHEVGTNTLVVRMSNMGTVCNAHEYIFFSDPNSFGDDSSKLRIQNVKNARYIMIADERLLKSIDDDTIDIIQKLKAQMLKEKAEVLKQKMMFSL